ncbi:MAG: hypothetical protein JXR97_06675 [Planctomycetes bacterium]|nr:hypothetical protein [Planctomycetota bacterium]
MRNLAYSGKPVEFDGISITLAKLVDFDRFNRVGFEAVADKGDERMKLPGGDQ